jgi:hypothetical protein
MRRWGLTGISSNGTPRLPPRARGEEKRSKLGRSTSSKVISDDFNGMTTEKLDRSIADY